MEVLTDILRGLRATGSVYFCDFLVPPWQLPYSGEDRAMFHLVRRGHCQIAVDEEVHDLVPGDFVFMAPGVDHVMRSEEIERHRRCYFAATVNLRTVRTTC